ncbi:hypothetical protein KW842_26840 [Duganella sp. sic0402]|uniref:hypothetical protein n=1 Tax=Duganella sp. sic0402 TaxID=2854786 RepID=UPI001C4583B8|nr:hypothetical protein [Duganella sp. sic0402]MBV7539394.1 hypothetical protein [Duganella sp. sic0402]
MSFGRVRGCTAAKLALAGLIRILLASRAIPCRAEGKLKSGINFKQTPAMTNRSANATIKGYFYQFDHTVVQVLSAPSPASVVTVEGIEDVDLAAGGESVLTQCKYYEGTEYNHSAIKDAVIHMLRHFKESGGLAGPPFRYRIYGHYSGGL